MIVAGGLLVGFGTRYAGMYKWSLDNGLSALHGHHLWRHCVLWRGIFHCEHYYSFHFKSLVCDRMTGHDTQNTDSKCARKPRLHLRQYFWVNLKISWLELCLAFTCKTASDIMVQDPGMFACRVFIVRGNSSAVVTGCQHYLIKKYGSKQ